MGCTQSKIENEEAVTRCKDRKHHMKDAVAARNAFAAAHSAYSMSLKNTGAALSDYAPGESHRRPSAATAAAAVQPPLEAVFRPPPLPNFQPSSIPLSRAASMPQIPLPKHDPHSSSTDPILEVDDEGEIDNNEESLGGSLRRRRRSSASRNEAKVNRPPLEQEIEDEDGPRPPPSPPPRRDLDRTTPPKQASPPPPMPSSDSSSWDFFFYENMTGPSLGVEETDEHRLRSEAMDRRRFEEKLKTTEEPATPEKQPEVRAMENDIEPPPPPPVGAVVAAPKPVVAVKKRKQAIKGGVGVNLVEVFNKLDDHFLKASESAHDVSMMLEANRLHYHSNFADNRGTCVYL